jgi:predicted SprT family Zn-dependent metalloprotease
VWYTPKLKAARELAVKLMGEHGLRRYCFRFNRCKTKLGYCRFPCRKHGGIIELSHYFTELNSTQIIRDTILHEIAHALAYKEYNDSGHGHFWKKVCLKIGAVPKACVHVSSINCPKKAYKAACSSCGTQYARHRISYKQGRFYYCTQCGEDKGRLAFRKV